MADKKLEKKVKLYTKPFSFHINVESFIPATEEEKRQQIMLRESTSFWKDGFRRLWKNKVAMTCVFILSIIILSIIIIPMVWPYTYDDQLGVSQGLPVDSSYSNLRPFEYGETEQELIASGESVFPHIFGTDSAGRDYFIRVIFGTRVSLSVGLFASLLVLIIGTIYGSIAGYVGGKVDLFMMRIVDIIYSLPDLLVIILLSVVFNQLFKDALSGTIFASLGANMISIFIVFGLLYWVGMARLIRGQILSLKEQDYVLAARSIGASHSRIIRKHLLPNSISVIIISTALQIPSAIFTESFLSFIGLGVAAPMPSLGSLASLALSGVFSYAYRLIIPALFISFIVLSLNLLGDGLRDAFDPKMKA
ncbi:MAG: ABC transporter permease [Bacilli bacterium]|nr:ABC transporter permease [Bacilli bacterium]MBN2876178.1 ABC transporter permease [Bacilli bacterium]